MDSGIEVFVKLPTGRAVQLCVDPTNTCFHLKQQITANHAPDYSPNQLIILFSSSVLEDTKQLRDYNIRHDSTVFVAIKQPSQDILGFDQCKVCHWQAIDPCVLHCGHSICKACLPAGASVCPVIGCDTHLQGQLRFPPNWLVKQFFNAKSPDKGPTAPMCQSCAEDGTKEEATHWCESCSRAASGMEYYCDTCVETEHSSKATRGHIRGPLDLMSSLSSSLPRCPKHKLPQDSYCCEDKIPVCYRCAYELHKGHTKIPVVEHERDVKNNLMSSIVAMTTGLEEEESALTDSVQSKKSEIERLKQAIISMVGRMKEFAETTTKAKLAAAVLTKCIDEFPTQDLFDEEKLETLQARIEATVRVLIPRYVSGMPTLKQGYKLKKTFGRKGFNEGEFNQPCGVIIQPYTNNIFVSDASNDRVQVFTSDGTFLHLFGEPIKQFDAPAGLAFDRRGNLVVVENGADRVQIVDSTTGERKRIFGSTGRDSEQLSGPLCVVMDHEGDLLVSDHKNCRIQKFTRKGEWLKSFGITLKHPCGLALDPKGNLLVVDRRYRVHTFDQNGQSIALLGGKGGKNLGRKQFPFLFAIAVDALGKIVITDEDGVKILSRDDLLETLKYTGTGKAANRISGVAITSEGDIVFVDSQTNQVQIYGPSLEQLNETQ